MDSFENSVESLQRENERLMDFIHSNKLLGYGTTVGGDGIAVSGEEEEVRKLVNDFIMGSSSERSSDSGDAGAVATVEMDHSDKSNDGDGGGYYIYDKKDEEQEEERTMTTTTNNNVLFADDSAVPDRFVETRTEPGSNGSGHNGNSRTATEVNVQDKM